ncbi:MAG: Fic family protein [Firmicutes bacterium]|nr:Fic family protein [Bacillota bacterium]
MNCAQMIKDIRCRLGLSQMELAGLLQVSFATVNRWENGRSKPAPAAMQKLRELCRSCNLQILEDQGLYHVIAIKEDTAYFEREEERISKKKALELFDTGMIDAFETGTFKGLAQIHGYLFSEIYDFAGKMRSVNIAKGNFRFAPVLYLKPALDHIEKMPQDTFDHIIEKYVEMNVAHPFREGNGRSMRIWLDAILKKELGQVIDWSKVDKEDYLLAMQRSPVKDIEIKALLKPALTDRIHDREVYMKGIDASYRYEGYNVYKTEELKE